MGTNNFFSESQHAYILSGDAEEALSLIIHFIQKTLGAPTEGNPDYSYERYDILGIDEARGLKENQNRRSFDGGYKFFVVSAEGITREAQNALLKVFEEPTEGTFIFLILPVLRIVLPTLRSRARVLKLKDGLRDTSQIKLFLKTPRGERLELPFIKKMVSLKERPPIVSFLESLEEYINQENLLVKKEFRQFFDDFLSAKKYLHDRAPSLKMILEHVALVAPTI